MRILLNYGRFMALYNRVKMARTVNNHMRNKQMKTHWNHINDCGDHDVTNIAALIERIEKLEKRTPDAGCSCDCSSQLQSIMESIYNINNNITMILDKLNNISISGSTISPTVRITPKTAYGLDTIDSTYTSLLSTFETADETTMDEYYSNVISKVLAGRSLTEPLSISEIEAATRCSELYDINNDGISNDQITWDDLVEEQKRAYIKQFILANPSNRVRALYITNELLKTFGVSVEPSTETTISNNTTRSTSEQNFLEDSTVITPGTVEERMCGCPYLMP